MGDLRTVAVLADIIAFLGEAAFAENINVGSPNGGWDKETNLGSWSSSRNFIVGDILIFRYSSMHDVLEVKMANFDSCQASSPLNSYNGGKTVILLDSPGKRYFICSTAGHCDRGMKFEVNLVAPASSSSSSPPATGPPKKAASPVMSPPTSRAPSPTSKEASPSVSHSGSPRDGSAASPPASGSPLVTLTPSSTQGFAPVLPAASLQTRL